MDSDDIMLPERMRKQMDYMTENPNIVCCGANIHMFSNPNNENLAEKKFANKTNHSCQITWDLFRTMKSEWFMNHPTLCYRKSAILSIGGYSEDKLYDKMEDYELYSRILRTYGELHNLPDILLYYRLHSGQITYGINSSSPEYVAIRESLKV
jgi:hypothetical protein